MAGSIEGRRHEWTLYVRIGIETWITDALIVIETQTALYSDSVYGKRILLVTAFAVSNTSNMQKAFNLTMAQFRVTVEWLFKEDKRYWTSVDFKRKLRVGEGPCGLMYIAACVLTRIRNCIYPNPIYQFFNHPPPSL